MSATDQQPTPQQGDGEHVNARRARQGFRDRPVLVVLVSALVLVAIAFVIAFATNNNPESAQDRGYARTNDAAVASTFDAPEPAPKVVPSN